MALSATVQVTLKHRLEARLQRDHALLLALAGHLQPPRARWAGDAVQAQRDGLGEADPRHAKQGHQGDVAFGPTL
jgi:hypothetical protein